MGGQEEKDLQEGSSNPALSTSDYFSGISEDISINDKIMIGTSCWADHDHFECIFESSFRIANKPLINLAKFVP